MFKVVATVFQQIMTDLNGAELEEDRIVAITKAILKLMMQNGHQGLYPPWTLNKRICRMPTSKTIYR
jgi:hypothetical protein